MDRFSLYYALAVVFAAAGLFVEDMGDSEVTFWPLIALGAIVSFVAIRVDILSNGNVMNSLHL